MSTPPVVRNDWSNGIDNRSDARRQGEKTVRDLVNLDPHTDGTLKLRAGYERIYAGADVRGLLARGESLLVLDGQDLVELDLRTNTHRVLTTVAAGGNFCGCELNGELFFCTADQALRYNGATLRDWGVPTVSVQPLPDVIAGSLPAGTYLVACTFVNAAGEEGGTVNPLAITVTDGAGLAFTLPTPPAGGKVRLYAAPAGGATLYLQAEGTDASNVLSIDQDSARLDTQLLRAPLLSQGLLAYNGVLLQITGSVLSWTLPLRPHLRDPLAYIQFPAPIDMVAPVDNAGGQGLFVAAGEATYYLSRLETTDVSQMQPLPYGAVAGTYVALPDGRATWMTRYGQAVGDAGGDVKLLSRYFVPEEGTNGAAVLLERDGQQSVVTTMRATPKPSGLAAGDYYLSEIITHDA